MQQGKSKAELPKGITEEEIPSFVALAGHPIHAMTVHFPIVLVFVTLGSDIFFWWSADPFWMRVSLWAIGFAFFTGVVAGLVGTVELLLVPQIRRRVESWTHAVVAMNLIAIVGLNWGLRLVDPTMKRDLATGRVDGARPSVVLVVGVNGTGKTTTTGKIARLLVAEDQAVVLAAADTFRAAAADQLQTWGDRVGAAVVRGNDGGDPAAVAFDAVSIAQQADADTVVIDTAGRLHTKTGLMDELGKVKRVVEKQSPIDEVLLVIDATTGQNGLAQARVFAEVVDVTGIVLTKLDGTARGGIVVAVQRELGVPVKLVGLGEGPDDLAPFDPEAFVDALVDA
jgi:signal recognition particle-docking protein FtsY